MSLWTLEDLLHDIEEQQFSRASFELIGMHSIQKECTNYHPSTNFSSVVNHQYRQESTSDEIGDFLVSTHIPALSSGIAIAIQSYSYGGQLRIRLVYETNRVSGELAAGLVQALRTTMEAFLRGPNTNVPDFYPLAMHSNLLELAEKSALESESQDYNESRFPVEADIIDAVRASESIGQGNLCNTTGHRVAKNS